MSAWVSDSSLFLEKITKKMINSKQSSQPAAQQPSPDDSCSQSSSLCSHSSISVTSSTQDTTLTNGGGEHNGRAAIDKITKRMSTSLTLNPRPKPTTQFTQATLNGIGLGQNTLARCSLARRSISSNRTSEVDLSMSKAASPSSPAGNGLPYSQYGRNGWITRAERERIGNHMPHLPNSLFTHDTSALCLQNVKS